MSLLPACNMLKMYMHFITQKMETALMRATRYGHTANVVELIKAGAELDLQDEVYI